MATHLKADEREFIAVHREAGRSIAWLSRTLGRARSTISREFKRNGSKGGYSAHIAQQRAERRHAEGRRKSRKMLRPELRPLVLEYLRLHWSPEQIAGALKLRFPADKRLHLAGHNHGGQICLPLIGPLVSPSRYGTRFAAGLFREGPTLLHVSRGLSGEHLPRWNCPPELTLLELV